MTTTYAVGYGSELYVSTDGTTYTKIAQTVDLAGPEPEVGEIKLTNNDSPDNTHEYAPGMIEPGEMDFDVIYSKAQASSLYGKFGDGNVYHFAEKYTDGAGWKFKGFIKKFGSETKTEDEANRNTITIKLTAKPTFHETLTVTTA